jgi:ribosomal protein L29
MPVLRTNDVKKMSPREIQTKMAQLERTLLELEGEGKHEKRKPVKKAIARLLTAISIANKAAKAAAPKTLNTGSAPKTLNRGPAPNTKAGKR